MDKNGTISLEEWCDPDAREWIRTYPAMATLFKRFDVNDSGDLDFNVRSLCENPLNIDD